jgi:hypothetical protein
MYIAKEIGTVDCTFIVCILNNYYFEAFFSRMVIYANISRWAVTICIFC